MAPSTPILWHIPVSHYNEKVRWALAHKGIEHERRAPPPGIHMLVAMGLTRSLRPTLPVLRLNGRTIGDSTAIIAELERRWPDPALYPADPAERRRALELEEYFDENLGPQIRLLVWHDLTKDSGGPGMGLVAAKTLPPRLREVAPLRAALGAFGSVYVKARFRVSSDERAERAAEAVIEALDRLERELDGGDYLVGDRFTVADLTAAALFYPLALPPEGPQVITADEVPPSFERFVAPLRDRPGCRWVAETYRRHRR